MCRSFNQLPTGRASSCTSPLNSPAIALSTAIKHSLHSPSHSYAISWWNLLCASMELTTPHRTQSYTFIYIQDTNYNTEAHLCLFFHCTLPSTRGEKTVEVVTPQRSHLLIDRTFNNRPELWIHFRVMLMISYRQLLGANRINCTDRFYLWLAAKRENEKVLLRKITLVMICFPPVVLMTHSIPVQLP